MPAKVLLDTNLLLLLIVVSTDRASIKAHKRLQSYKEVDFDLLQTLIARTSGIVVTSNILTEASNLARYIADPARTRIATAFRALLDRFEERHVRGRRAAE